MQRMLMIALCLTLLLATRAQAQVNRETNYEGNLAKVPAEDPPATVDIPVVQPMRGKHPRLIFTAEEIEKLKPHLESDPILKANWEATRTQATRFGFRDADDPSIVHSDTPALVTSNGRAPSLIYAWAIEKDPVIEQKIIDVLTMMLNQEHWAHAAELDANMGAGNNMLMVGLLFDAVYDELEPDFRLKMARKMLTHCRRMYHLGHLQKNTLGIYYWQQDPANNHRWHRNAGLAACLLSIMEIEELETDWLVEQFRKEMDFIFKWLPEHGDCHEGQSYQTFGFHYLVMSATMSDRVLGTAYLKHPGLRHAWEQQFYSYVPKRKGHVSYGDCSNRANYRGNLTAAFFTGPRLSRDPVAQAAMEHFYNKQTDNGQNLGFFGYPWMVLAHYDPTVKTGDFRTLPTHRLFADMGVAYLRDSWDYDAALMMFKCGPYGGYALNAYRNANDFHYVNIAHDDPDANTMALCIDGEMVLHPGVYFVGKRTEQHNTLLAGGKGQVGEGDKFTQPIADTDMTTLSYLTGWKHDLKTGRAIVEGEAGNAYPALKRFRRSLIWMPGQYVLAIDDVAADGRKDIRWLANSQKIQFADPEAGVGYFETEMGKRYDFQIRASQPFKGAIDHMLFRGRWASLLINQVQFRLKAEQVRFACLIDVWQQGVRMAFDDRGATATVTVTGEGFEDVWTIQRAKDMKTPSAITGKRNGELLIRQTADDRAPHGGMH